HYTNYGKAVVEHIVGGLVGYQVGIVSGLAIGIDGLAHEAALRHHLYTLAIPGGGLDDTVLYPARHKRLAYRILEAGGTLLSEYEPTQRVARWTFPQRNRLVCGLAQATVVIEAAEQSGSLITARMATDYNRELFVVPGDIFSPVSRGTHQFLKLGATPLTDAKDIIDALELKPTPAKSIAADTAAGAVAPAAQTLLCTLTEPMQKDELIRRSGIATAQANVLLMELELTGHIAETDGTYRRRQ
ncbi:MAG TPA: DNA-processing protein DprA, partial [Candidatus Paceibacterota bacterium]|nr:DNA-processing protein DprA [Candidatus Paceibacterota bacterium]